MQMIMSTISSTADRRADAGSDSDLLTTVAAKLKRLWVAYMIWRVERSAIALLLRSTGDPEADAIDAVGPAAAIGPSPTMGLSSAGP